MLDLNDLLRFTIDHRGSDLHVKVGVPPHVRVDGHLMATPFDPVTPADTEAGSPSPSRRPTGRGALATRGDGLRPQRPGLGSVPGERLPPAGLGRARAPAGPPRDAVRSSHLGLPRSVVRLADAPRGLVLVTGPTGSGRTTTAAAMVDHINETRVVNIVTIEDPIEVLHVDKMAIVNQRELGTDTRDYAPRCAGCCARIPT